MKPFCKLNCKHITKWSVHFRRHKLKLIMLLVLCSCICHLLVLNFSGRSSTDAVINQDTVRLQTLHFTATDKNEDTSSTVTTLSNTYSLPATDKHEDSSSTVTTLSNTYSLPATDKNEDTSSTVTTLSNTYSLPATDKHEDTSSTVTTLSNTYSLPATDKHEDTSSTVTTLSNTYSLPATDKNEDTSSTVTTLSDTYSLPATDKHEDTSSTVTTLSNTYSLPATDKHEDTSSTVTTLSGTYSLPVQPKNTRKWQDSFTFIYSNGRYTVTDENAPYVAVFPYSTTEDKVSQDFVEEDKLALQKLSEFLDTMEEFDGATCTQPAATPNAQKDHVLQHEQINIIRNSSLDSSWCRFIINKWSLHIRNSGRIRNIQLRNKPFTDESSNESSPVDSKSGEMIVLQICNIIQGPFIIRNDVFNSIGELHQGFGRVALLEFFIRSKGKLKMAKLSNCAWTREITRVDRGTLEGSNHVPEYAAFGNKHGILRIVTDNRIEWTECVANWKLCREKPYVEPRELPGVAAPICCSAVLFQMLKDITWAFTELGVEYRVVYGTLLGAVRSQAIIPWTCDIDIALNRSTYVNASTYTAIEKLLRNQYYVGNSFMGMPRAHMLIPPYIEVDTAPFFDGPDDLQGNLLFSSDIEKAVRDMPPVSARWRDRGYVDFYVAPSVWLNDSSLVTINNQQFITVKEIEKKLTNWYGKDYRQPVVRGEWVGYTDRGSA